MLNVKTAYIRGFLIAIAIFGLTDCSKSSKNDPAKVGQEDVDDETPVTGAGYFDPTRTQTEQTAVRRENYDPLGKGNPIITNAKLSDDLYYTDSSAGEGNNSLMNFLKKQSRIDGNEDANAKFASQLTLSQVIVNPNDPRSVVVNFEIKRGKKAVSYQMNGQLQEMSKYDDMMAADLKSASGPKDVSAFIRCVDEDQDTCFNSVVTFVDKSKEQTRKAFAVFRTTPVEIGYSVINHEGGIDNDNMINLDLGDEDGDFGVINKMGQLLDNSRKRKKFPFVQNAIVETASVALGRSSFNLFVRIKNKNKADSVVPVFGPLVSRRHQADITPLELAKPKSLVLKDSAKSPLDPITKSIQSYNLIGNDSRGSIQVLLNFGADQQNFDHVVILKLTRPEIQLRALND